MRTSRLCFIVRIAAVLAMAGACGSPTAPQSGDRGPAVLTSVRISLGENPIEIGQSTVAEAAAFDQFGAPIAAGAPAYASASPETAGVSPTTGDILAIAPGTTIITATIDGKVAQQTVTVVKAPILINEVKPDGEATGGWVELFNPTGADVDVSAWTLTASDVFHSVALPPGTTIRAGGYLAINETRIPFGLKSADTVHVFSRFGVHVDSFAWTVDPPTSYGRCPDGTGAFVITAEDSKGSVNACSSVRPVCDSCVSARSER